MIETWCKIILLLLLFQAEVYSQSAWLPQKVETPAGYKWGFYNTKGKVQLEPVYDSVFFNFTNGFAAVGQLKNDRIFAGLVDKKGKVVLPYSYANIQVLGNYFLVESPDHLQGLMDTELNIVVKPLYKSLSITDSGATCTIFPEFDIYTTKGTLIQSISADSIRLNNGYLSGFRNENVLPLIKAPLGLEEIKRETNTAESDSNSSIESSWQIVKEGNYYGFTDTSGKVLISIQYEDAKPFSYGLAPVKIMGKWAYINGKEDFVIQPNFDEAWPFFGNSAKVFVNGSFNFIDRNGTLRNKYGFTKVELLPSGNWQIWSGNSGSEVGLADSLGREIIIPKYTRLLDWGTGYARFLKHGLYGVLDYSQNIIVPGKYIQVFMQNEYFVGQLSNSSSFIKPIAKK